jgi:hypothetical protein
LNLWRGRRYCKACRAELDVTDAPPCCVCPKPCSLAFCWACGITYARGGCGMSFARDLGFKMQWDRRTRTSDLY